MGCCNLVGIRMFSISFGINYKLGIIELKYVLVHTVAQEVFLPKEIFFKISNMGRYLYST